MLAATLVSVGAQAGIVVNGTRFIYPAKQQEIGVRISNDGTLPSLVQVWVDRGDPDTRPEDAEAPFLLTPPIFRVDPNQGQSVRLAFTGESLPGDRESLFWLNLLDIPPVPADAGNVMQFAIRTRLKLFYRPEGLSGRADQAATGMRWQLAKTERGHVLRATNPSPFHISFSELGVKSGGREYKTEGGMVRPFGSQDFPFSGAVAPPASGTVILHWINDYGAPIREEARLQL